MYTSLSDTGLEWPREGSLFELDSNKRRGGGNGAAIPVTSAIFEGRPAALGQIWHLPGSHK